MDTVGSAGELPGRKRKRRSWALSVFLVAVLLIGGAGFFWTRKMQERKVFVSEVDAATGYRCRFTLGAGWKHEPTQVLPATGINEMNREAFRPVAANPIQQWVGKHLLPRLLSPPGPAEIDLFVEQIDSPEGVSLKDGYPDYVQATVPISERHLIIDGCRATAATYSNSTTLSSYETSLTVCTPNHKIVYQVIAFYLRPGDPTDREMQEIIRSFHIEKISKGAGKQ